MSRLSSIAAHAEGRALAELPQFREWTINRFRDSKWARFATARMDAFHAKQQGRTFCAAEFPSLSFASYTNPFRMFDRGSQYVVNEIANRTHWTFPEKMLHLFLYRQFNLPESYEMFRDSVLAPMMDARCETLGEIMYSHNGLEDIAAACLRYHTVCTDAGVKLYSRAYLRNGGAAYTRYLELMPGIVRTMCSADLRNALESIYIDLRAWEGFGDFLAYQLALDINYCLEESRPVDFVVPGPGAIKGMDYAIGPVKPAERIATIKVLAEPNVQKFILPDFKAPDGPWVGETGDTLEAVRLLEENDVQNLFCEFSKTYRIDVLGDRVKRPYAAGRTAPMKLALPLGYFQRDYGVPRAVSLSRRTSLA